MNKNQQSEKSHLPLVSVIIPAYNAEKFLEITLQSVLSQTYQNIEVLVIDDGSQDGTADIVKTIAKQDSRLILLQQSNSGVSLARNLGIEKCRGEFIAPMDADDIWYSQNLEKQVNCMIKSDISVGLVYAWSVDIDENDSLTGGFHASLNQGNVYLHILYQNFIGNASSVLIRRTCFETVGGYDYQHLKDESSHGSEDWEMYLRIAENYQFAVVPEFTVAYRKTAVSASYNDIPMAKFFELAIQMNRTKHPEIPAQIFCWSSSHFYLYLAYQSFHAGNYSRSLTWLYKTLQLDLTMTLLRHDIYILTLKVLSKIIMQYVKSAFMSKYFSQTKIGAPKSSYTIKYINLTLSDIYKLVKIREFVPYKIYEKYRFRKLEKSNFLSN